MATIVGIIGVRGRYGSWLRQFFEKRGDFVIGSDKGTAITTEHVIAESDVVIFAVPIRSTLRVIRAAVPHAREGQLWMDITSVKVDPIEEMLRSCAEVVGLHPLCAPPKGPSLEGHALVVCHARLSVWRPWVKSFLVDTKAHIRRLEAGPHDQLMLAEQNLVHLSTLMVASAARKMNVPPEKLFDFATPLSRLTWASVGRVLSQDPDLYLEIQLHNPGTREMISVCQEFLVELAKVVDSVDSSGQERGTFIREFLSNREYFASSFLQKSAEIFDKSMKK